MLCRLFRCVRCLFGVSNLGLFGFSLGWSVWYGLVIVMIGFSVVVSGVWLSVMDTAVV